MKHRGRPIQARDMKWRITLQRRVATYDSMGGKTGDGWTDYQTVWAKVADDQFTYQTTGDAPHGYSVKKFTIYYDERVGMKDFCVVFDSRRYRIISLKVYDESDRFMEITADGNLMEMVI